MGYLEVKNVTKKYANHLALSNVSVEVPRGSIFGLLGPNGAGKTTLIRIITRITAPDSGDIYMNGEPFTEQHVQSIGYLPEERGLYKKMKVGEQALYLARLKGMSKQSASSEINKWFEKFDIKSWYNKKVEELSKGMQQKVQFISTIIHEPELLIFDEPFSGFDPINAEILKKEIIHLKNQGRTIILSTHNMESVEELCDEIALINKSRVVLHGKVTDIKEAYKENILRFTIKADVFEMQSPLFTLISEDKHHPYIDIRIKKTSDIDNSELIKTIIQHYNVLAFEEELPTMNEVFIKTVIQQQATK